MVVFYSKLKEWKKGEKLRTVLIGNKNKSVNV